MEAVAPAWSVRLTRELTANDEAAKAVVAGLTEEQLNWQPSPGCWSVGQCVEHLCVMNEVYLPPIAKAMEKKADSPVEEITHGAFSRWFIRSFAEPSAQAKQAKAPPKIRPTRHVSIGVLERFLAGNQACREVIARARTKNVNRIRFWNPFIPGLRFTAGSALQIIASHERRHLLQAQRVRDLANFPR